MAKRYEEYSPERPVMRLVRCRYTHRYFNGTAWTQDPKEARKFSDVIEVACACAEYCLQNVELVLRPLGAQTDLFITPIR